MIRVVSLEQCIRGWILVAIRIAIGFVELNRPHVVPTARVGGRLEETKEKGHSGRFLSEPQTAFRRVRFPVLEPAAAGVPTCNIHFFPFKAEVLTSILIAISQ